MEDYEIPMPLDDGLDDAETEERNQGKKPMKDIYIKVKNVPDDADILTDIHAAGYGDVKELHLPSEEGEGKQNT